MKKDILTILLLMIVFAGCSHEEAFDESLSQQLKEVRISAKIAESDSKASLDSETGKFAWQSGDILSVLATDGKFYDFVLEGESGGKKADFVGQIPGNAKITTVAVYPKIVENGSANTIYSNGTLNYTLPSEWTYAKDESNVPMVASFSKGAKEMAFKQVGGVMRFPVKNLPIEATFVLTMKGKTITGDFPMNIAKLESSYMAAGDTDSEVAISYSSEIEGASADFNIPVPVGTYNEFTVSVKDAEGNVIFTKEYKKEEDQKDIVVERATLVVMKELTLPKRPKFTAFYINGQKGVINKEFVNVQFPYGTDVTALKTEFVINEGIVTVNDTEIQTPAEIDYSSPVKFNITADDGTVKTFIVSVSYSQLPVVYINTKDGAPIVSKENWLKGSEIYVTNAGDYNALYKESSIRGRGNTTWGNPKKPYAIKLDSKEEVLGMPKHKRWVLLANYFDKTCIRNAVAFEIARRSNGLDWTPRGKHVDVVLNGAFIGNYYLCEQIKVDKNRVNITEMESGDIDSESISGGYLLEVDTHYDEVNKFMSYNSVVLENGQFQQLPFMIKEPDEDVLGAVQFSWIQNHIEKIRVALYEAGSTTAGYLQYIDLDSFIDYWLVYELTGTGEPTHPKSVYMHKDRGGKMHAGPVWDFDYYTFQSFYKNKLINTRAVWNDRIINDPTNWPIIKQRWNACKDNYRSIAEEIDRLHNYTKESAQYNAQLWPITTIDINKENSLSVEEAVTKIKDYYVEKFNYMDSYINTYF